MGVRFSAADSGNLITAMRHNVAMANAIVDRLQAGSQHLISQLDAGVLRGAAFTAGRGLFSELILPGIAKLSQAVDDIEAELMSYEHAHSVVAEYGDLDLDELVQRREATVAQLGAIERQLEHDESFLAMLEAFVGGDVDGLMERTRRLNDLRDVVADRLVNLTTQIEKLEWFAADVARYFSDSLQVMQRAVRAAVELNKIAVEPDGSFHTNGVNLAFIRGLAESKVTTHKLPGGIEQGTALFDDLESAAKLSYDKLSEWLNSEQGRRLHDLARRNPGLFDSMLREAFKLRVEGNPFGALGALLNLLSENGWLSLQGGFTILDKFQTNGEWDQKRYLADKFSYHGEYFFLHDEQGRTVRSDVFGNVVYGAMFAHWGLDRETALNGANMGSGGGVDAGVSNDPLDDRAVEFGFDLYKKYPNGLTEQQYYEEIANANLTK